jgi:hypothetical protein
MSKELRKANEAREFLRNADFPSENEAIHLIRDGNLKCPSICSRYQELF